VVLFEKRGEGAHHHEGIGFVGFLHLNDLETPSQRCVLFEILLVLRPGGGGNGAQLAAGQGRLEQIGGIARPGGAARANQGMSLVDK